MNFSYKEAIATFKSIIFVILADNKVSEEEKAALERIFIAFGIQDYASILEKVETMSSDECINILKQMSEDKKAELFKMWTSIMNADTEGKDAELEVIIDMSNHLNINPVYYLTQFGGNQKSNTFQRKSRPIDLKGSTWESTDGKHKMLFDLNSLNGAIYNGSSCIYKLNATQKTLYLQEIPQYEMFNGELIDIKGGLYRTFNFKILDITISSMKIQDSKGEIIQLYKK